MKKTIAIDSQFRYTDIIGTTEFQVHALVASGRMSPL